MSWFRWAPFGVVTVAAAALGELGARRLIRAQGFYGRYQPYFRARMEIDAMALPEMEKVVWVEINRDGERGDPPPPRGERAFRALVIGGSVAECFFLDQQSTWPAVTQRTLREAENLARLGVPRAHVGTVARPIVTCGQTNLILERILPRYPQLDVILIMTGASDVVSWLEKKAPPVVSEDLPPASKLFEVHPEGPWSYRPTQTALYQLGLRLYRRIQRPVMVTKNAGGWLHRVRKMRAEAPVILDEAPDPTPMLASFDRHFRELIRTAQGGARRVIVVRQPWFDREPTPEEMKMFWNFGLGRPYREQVDTYCSWSLVSRLMTQIDERAAAAAEDLGVSHVNLRPSLLGHAGVYYDTLHFTPIGAELVGRAVAAAILEQAGSAAE